MRIPWIDCCKGLAMLMVVLGHCGENEYFFKGLYYIHLPLFILLSGFLLDNSKYYDDRCSLWKVIKKKSGELLYPYLVFGAMTILLQYFRMALTGVNFDCGGVKGLVFNICYFENYANWFLPVLFGSEILCIMLFKLLNNYNRNKEIFIVFILLIFAYISNSISPILPHLYRRSFTFFFLFKFGQIFTFSFFLIIGHLIKVFIMKNEAKLKASRKLLVPIMLGSSIISLFTASNLPMVDLHVLRWESTKIYLLVACWGSISFFFLFYLLDISNRLLSYIGRNSLIINGTHLNLLIVPGAAQILFFSWPHLASAYNLGPLLLTISVFLIEIILIIPIIRNVYPVLCDYKILPNTVKSFRSIFYEQNS